MILRVSQLKGKRVMTEEGKKVEDVDDVLYDPQKKRIIAFLVSKGGLFSQPKVLLLQDVKETGPDDVMIEEEDKIKTATDLGENIALLAKDKKMTLSGSRLMDEEGREYGKSSDVFFDDRSGRVLGFEYRKGEPLPTKKTMKIEEIVSVGQDAVVIKPVMKKVAVKKDNTNQSGQFPSSQQIEQASAKITEQTNRQIGMMKQQVSRNMKNIPVPDINKKGDKTADKPKPPPKANSTPNKQAKFTPDEIKKMNDAVGKYLVKNILTPQDQLVGRQGQIITHQLLQDAYVMGVLDQVLQNTTSEKKTP